MIENERGVQTQRWLERIGKSRTWYAEQLGLKGGVDSVGRYFGPRGKMPDRAWERTQELMEEVRDFRHVKLSIEEFLQLQSISEAKGISIEDLVVMWVREGMQRFNDQTE